MMEFSLYRSECAYESKLNTRYTRRTHCFELLEISMRTGNVIHSRTVTVFQCTEMLHIFYLFEEIGYFLRVNTPTAFSSITYCGQALL